MKFRKFWICILGFGIFCILKLLLSTLPVDFVLTLLILFFALFIARYIINKRRLHSAKNTYLKYSFIDNGILLKMEVIEKNGFHEVYRQQYDEYGAHSIQILCFNEETGEFQAFDRFHWMDEPYFHPFCGPNGNYKEDLWTPIKFHYTEKWLKEYFWLR